jgi:hypothetical protein
MFNLIVRARRWKAQGYFEYHMLELHNNSTWQSHNVEHPKELCSVFPSPYERLNGRDLAELY